MSPARLLPLAVPLAALLAWIDLGAFARLAEARTAHRVALEAAAAPRIVLRGTEALDAPDAATARETLAHLLADRAAADGAGATIEAAGPAGAPGLVACTISAEGDEASLRALAHGIDGGRPLIRLIDWHVTQAGDRLRLDAHALALWRRR